MSCYCSAASARRSRRPHSPKRLPSSGLARFFPASDARLGEHLFATMGDPAAITYGEGRKMLHSKELLARTANLLRSLALHVLASLVLA